MAKATGSAVTSVGLGDVDAPDSAARTRPTPIELGLLTGGIDRHYSFGLSMALVSKGIRVDVIGSDGVDSAEMHTTPGLNFLNLQRSSAPGASLAKRISWLLGYYARLIRYSWIARPKIFHILWNNKLQYFDRTLLMLYYKLLGKKVVLTAHNVNAAKRDANDSRLNRLSLKMQYRLADHVFVHTQKMKTELVEEYGVRTRAVTVIPYGINNAVPYTGLAPAEAKERLGLGRGDRAILFFGNLRPSKGLEYLVTAFQLIAPRHPGYRLIIAGEAKKGSEQYMWNIQEAINGDISRNRVIQRIGFVPDIETEVYFKAADVLALPYTDIFQSGVLFMGYAYGLPAIASDVGSFREDVIEGKTGFVCRPHDPVDLATTIEKYFESDLFKSLDSRRPEIRDYTNRVHSWDVVGEMTRDVYTRLLEPSRFGVPSSQ
jgi:glycosyltransferase involved in cell wall biosynthesis